MTVMSKIENLKFKLAMTLVGAYFLTWMAVQTIRDHVQSPVKKNGYTPEWRKR